MKRKDTNKTRIIGIRLSPGEYERIEKRWKASTCRKLSEYVRRSLFDKHIVTTYRNRSLDDFMTEMIKLRGELSSIGNNFNQTVKKLHTLSQIGEFRPWIMSNEIDKKILFNKIDEIKRSIKNIAEKWLQ